MAPQVEEGTIRVVDKIYSADKLATLHPGGPLFIKVRHTRKVDHNYYIKNDNKNNKISYNNDSKYSPLITSR